MHYVYFWQLVQKGQMATVKCRRMLLSNVHAVSFLMNLRRLRKVGLKSNDVTGGSML